MNRSLSGTFAAAPPSAKGLRMGHVGGMLLVLVAATLHNSLGILAAIVFAAANGSLLRRRLNVGWFSGAFYLIAAYVLVRALFPSLVPFLAQSQEVVRFVAFAIFAYALHRLRVQEIALTLMLFLAFLLLPFALDLATGAFLSGDYRYRSLMPHANHLGYVCATVLITFLYLHFSRLYSPRGLYVFLAAALGMLVASKSSGALFVFMAGVLMIFLSFRFSVTRLVYAAMAVVAVVMALQTPLGQYALEKITVSDLDLIVEKARSHQFGNQGSSFAWRMSYWIAMIEAQFDSGSAIVLFGQGGGSTGDGNRVFDFISKDPHSDFVRLFIEYGVVGSLLILALLARGCMKAGPVALAMVILFGPMLTGNSIISPPVMFPILMNLFLLKSLTEAQK